MTPDALIYKPLFVAFGYSLDLIKAQ